MCDAIYTISGGLGVSATPSYEGAVTTTTTTMMMMMMIIIISREDFKYRPYSRNTAHVQRKNKGDTSNNMATGTISVI